MSTERRRRLLAGAGLTLLAGLLLLWRLDVPLLWQDEAETANVAEGVLLHGFPTPWDGAHLVTQQAGRDSIRVRDRPVWAWHPWLQHYLAAAGLGLLGHGTAAARLPFALVALASVPLLFAWRLRRTTFGGAVAATAVYTLAPAFFLYGRQSRYYALLLLGGVWALAAYQRQRGPADRAGSPEPDGGAGSGGRRPWISLALALALLFYANPLTGLASAAGMAGHTLLGWIRRRRDGHGAIGAALAAALRSFALFAALATPWLLLTALSDVRPPAMGLDGRAELLASQGWRLQYTILPVVLWPALWWVRRRARREGDARGADEVDLLVWLGLTSWLAVGALAPMGTARYAVALWPLAAACLGTLWSHLHRRSVLAAAGFLAALTLTNAFQALPAAPLALARQVPAAYDREAPVLDKLAQNGRLTAPLPLHLASLARRECGPVAAVVGVGRALRRPPRLVVAAYGWESLHFYLGTPAVGSGLQASARQRLGLPEVDPDRADLVIPRRGWPPLPEGLGRGAAFVEVSTGVPDHAYENLPDPTGHWYTRADGAPFPPVTAHVRRELLPEAGLETVQAPGCAPLDLRPRDGARAVPRRSPARRGGSAPSASPPPHTAPSPR
ncbi:MAG: hypothetical protein ACLF0P_01625 [Thermoanaerobaculia bacterium]